MTFYNPKSFKLQNNNRKNKVNCLTKLQKYLRKIKNSDTNTQKIEFMEVCKTIMKNHTL